MQAAYRRGLLGAALLGSATFLLGTACSEQLDTQLSEPQLVGEAGVVRKAARPELANLLGKATVAFGPKGKHLVPLSDARGGEDLNLGMELPLLASDAMRVFPKTTPERSLVLRPVAGSDSRAAVASDGSAVYERAFGSADLVQSATLDGLRTQVAVFDAQSPDLFVWQTALGEGLRAVPRDDLGTDLVDADQSIWLSVSPVTITDGAGSTSRAALRFDGDGFARLRLDHRNLTYPALLDFEITLGGGVRALAIVPTQIKGRVMVLLDTSGSMIGQFGSDTNTGGDSPPGQALVCDNALGGGSTYACDPAVACTAANGGRPYWPVADAAQPSRMLAAKLALQNVVNANSGLLDFGLERYAEAGNCANPLYCCNPQINGTTRGLCADNGNYTDIPNTGSTSDLSYSGGCGTPYQGGRVLVSPGAGSGPQLIPWVDFVEDFCSSTGVVGGAPRNPELRGDGNTPLGRSIVTAREEWYRPIYDDSRQAGSQPLDDTLIDCRPYVLVVMTDGDDTCNAGDTYDYPCSSDADCGGSKCFDANTGGGTSMRCGCSGTVACTGQDQSCNLGAETQDCSGQNSQCGSGNCVDTPGNGDNWRCSCANNADCGAGMTCQAATTEVDCRGDDNRCLSNDCYDAPGPGTNWRCACTSDAQCAPSETCDVANNRCRVRGVCQAAGVCEIAEPLPRDQVQRLTDINGVNPVKTYVLGMGDPTGINETELDAMAVAGGTADARFASSQAEIEAAFADIVANTVKYEICNGVDDNCNARIDEGLGVYQECLTAADCNGGACNAGRCVCNGDAQCASGYACSNETPTRFCRPSCSEGQGACFVSGVRKCGVGIGQCCVNDASPTCTDIVPPSGTAEVCNNIDDNCNGFVDENLACQGCVPLPEVCNGKDDDCDGLADELEDPGTPGMGGLVDVGGPCGSAVGRCTPGTAVCTGGKLDCSGDTGPFTEVCNGYDDDCDGVTDGMDRACYTGPANTEDVGICHGGTQVCTATANSGVEKWGSCTGQQLPTNEICNGVDDDCNGAIDDGVPAPLPSQFTGDECCGDGVSQAQCGVGQCSKGTWACAGNVVVCDNAGRPTNETCDGVDNDCNGDIDDIPSIGGDCVAPGGCSGKLQCDSDQKKLVCVPQGSAGKEVCDGIDNDCDGKTDEIEDLEVNEEWFGDDCEAPPAGHDKPPCKPGKLICKNGVPRVCEGAVGPLPEVCDLKDTDCDGVSDTPAACPGENACIQGVCVERCGGGEFPCPGGYDCRSFPDKNDPDKTTKYCIPTVCDDALCPPGASCQNGECTLDGAGGAGNTGAGGDGNGAEGGQGSSRGASGSSAGGADGEPGQGGGAESEGGAATGATGTGASGNTSVTESRGVYGLVTGGGGCSCRTAPPAGSKWMFALSALVLGAAYSRRRRREEGRAA